MTPSPAPTPAPLDDEAWAAQGQVRHPEGCMFCPAELLGLPRDRNGDPLCQTCPHLRKEQQ